MWNNIGSNIKDGLLETKYEFFKKHGLEFPSLNLEMDDSLEFQTYLRKVLESLVSTGVIYKDSDTYSACSDCGHCIGISSSSRISKCSKCPSENIIMEARNGLFLDLPTDKISLINGKTPAFKNIKQLHTRFNHLPNRINLEKIRPTGLSLDFLGFDGFVLDPKFGISLLPHFVAQKYEVDKITQVQGYETITNTAPYTNTILSNIDFEYILTGLADNNCQFLDEEVNFVLFHLPVFLIGFDSVVSESRIDQLKEDYKKTVRKLSAVINGLELSSESVVPLDRELLNQAIDYFAQYKYKDGIIAIKEFVKQLNKNPELQKQVSKSDINTINQTFGLIFKI